MNNNPRENIRRLAAVRIQVLEHPMCLHLNELDGATEVLFPAGDFPVHGLRCKHTKGKAAALQILLDRMERIWLESFPGYRA